MMCVTAAVVAVDAQAGYGHPATPTALAPADLTGLIVVIAPILALVAWGLARVRRARTAVRAALDHGGYAVVRLEQRLFRSGPLFWTTTRSQIVYRVIVRDDRGRQRTGWARWGRTWLTKPDTLELRWDD
jgi:hypothetical protein